MNNSTSDDVNSAIESLEHAIGQGIEDEICIIGLDRDQVHELSSKIDRYCKCAFPEKIQMDCDDSDKYHLHCHHRYGKCKRLQGVMNLWAN